MTVTFTKSRISQSGIFCKPSSIAEQTEEPHLGNIGTRVYRIASMNRNPEHCALTRTNWTFCAAIPGMQYLIPELAKGSLLRFYQQDPTARPPKKSPRSAMFSCSTTAAFVRFGRSHRSKRTLHSGGKRQPAGNQLNVRYSPVAP